MNQIECIKDVDMYHTNISGERVRNGITSFIKGCNYEVGDYDEETGNAILINHQGDKHHWNFNEPVFAKHFNI